MMHRERYVTFLDAYKPINIYVRGGTHGEVRDARGAKKTPSCVGMSGPLGTAREVVPDLDRPDGLVSR